MLISTYFMDKVNNTHHSFLDRVDFDSAYLLLLLRIGAADRLRKEASSQTGGDVPPHQTRVVATVPHGEIIVAKSGETNLLLLLLLLVHLLLASRPQNSRETGQSAQIPRGGETRGSRADDAVGIVNWRGRSEVGREIEACDDVGPFAEAVAVPHAVYCG